MSSQKVKDHLDRLSHTAAAADRLRAVADQAWKENAEAHDTALLRKLAEQMRAVLTGTKRSSGNTLRYKGSKTSPQYIYVSENMYRGSYVRTDDLLVENYRLKARVWGINRIFTPKEMQEKLRTILYEELLNTKDTVEIRSVEFKNVRNWWRGGWPNFYQDATEEDFTLVIGLGTPLITRPLAYLFDHMFPRVSVRVEFCRKTLVPVADCKN